MASPYRWFISSLSGGQDPSGKACASSDLRQRKWPRWGLRLDVFSDPHKPHDDPFLRRDIRSFGFSKHRRKLMRLQGFSSWVFSLGRPCGGSFEGGVGVFRESLTLAGCRGLTEFPAQSSHHLVCLLFRVRYDGTVIFRQRTKTNTWLQLTPYPINSLIPPGEQQHSLIITCVICYPSGISERAIIIVIKVIHAIIWGISAVSGLARYIQF